MSDSIRPPMESSSPEPEPTAAAEDYVHIEDPDTNVENLGESFVGVDDVRPDEDDAADASASRSIESEESNQRMTLPEELSRSVMVLSCDSSAEGGDCDVYLVGTAHVSQESCREVEAVISYLKPQVVFFQEMEANSAPSHQETEEEFVLLNLEAVHGITDIPPNAPYILSGLDTSNPILIIDNKLKLIGQYEETIGTCVVFSQQEALPIIHEETGPSETNMFSSRGIVDPNQTSGKEVKPVASLTKILKFRLSPDFHNVNPTLRDDDDNCGEKMS